MKKFVSITLSFCAFIVFLSGCQQPRQETIIGGGAGALIGSVVATDPLTGAVIGGVIGGLTGQLIGQSKDRPGYCIYRDRNGNAYQKLCPTRDSLIGPVQGRTGFCTYMNSFGRTYTDRCPS